MTLSVVSSLNFHLFVGFYNMIFDGKKIPMLLDFICFGLKVTQNSSNKRRFGTAALIRGRRLFE